MEKDKLIREALKRDYDLLESLGYTVLGVFLYGSQNYGLDYEDSDIDTKAIVIPKFGDFVRSVKATSHTIKHEDTKAHLDVKDIRLMFEQFRKQNTNFLEILFTDYMLINPKYQDLFQTILENREEIARYNPAAGIGTMRGMAYEKRKALTHPYPSIVHKIEKFGYDPKQLHHILRIEEMLGRFVEGESYASLLKSEDVDFLLAVKVGEVYKVEHAKIVADLSILNIDEMANDYYRNSEPSMNVEMYELMNDVVASVLKRAFKEEF